MIDPRVQALCDEFGIEIIGKNRYPGPGQTRAVGTIRKVIDRTDMEHARLMMSTLAETSNNKACLDREAFGSTSGLILARPDEVEQASKWLAVFDAMPLGELQFITQDLRGFFPLNAVLAGMMYERIWRAFGPRSIQPDLLDDRRRT